MSTILEVEKVNMSYFGGNVGVRNLSFSLQENENLCFFGREFQGKSSVARVLCGLEKYQGIVKYKGINLQDMQAKDRNLSYSFDLKSLKKSKTVRENILLPLKIRNVDEDSQLAKLEELSKLIGLETIVDKKVKTLGKFEQTKTLLARIFVRECDIYFVDNIFCELEKSEKDELFNLFLAIVSQTKNSVVYFTDSVEQARSFGGRVAVLSDCKIVQQGEFDELLVKPFHLECAKMSGGEVDVFELEKRDNKYFLISENAQIETKAPIDELYVGKKVVAIAKKKEFVDCYFDLASEYRVSQE
ncbi:MAG: ATP-binding cassette domain-containing protein [Clostridia bacterium]